MRKEESLVVGSDDWNWGTGEVGHVPQKEIEEEKPIASSTEQRLGTKKVVMEQTYREFTVKDLNDALEVIMEVFRGKNILKEVTRELMRRGFERHETQQEMADELGITKRMCSYYKHRQLSEGAR